MRDLTAVYRLLGDEARLRLLRLLGRERLNVTELTGILGIAQSGVSRHLGLLKDAGLVVEAREGGFAYYRLADADGGRARARLFELLDAQFTEARDGLVRADEARLHEVLRLRKENFETHGAAAGRERQLVPGRSWAAWARALGYLLPPATVADLGCGEGYLAIEASRWARQVIAVDRSAAVIQRARALARRRRVSNIVWKRGDIERVPLPDASVDVALLSQALHHASQPARALAEAARILVPGGRVLVLDLRAHDQIWVRERLGDRWLGFDDAELARLLRGAGLERVDVRVGARRTGDPFVVLIASGIKPLPDGGRRAKGGRRRAALSPREARSRRARASGGGAPRALRKASGKPMAASRGRRAARGVRLKPAGTEGGRRTVDRRGVRLQPAATLGGRRTVDRRGVRLQPAATEGGRPTVDRRGVQLQPAATEGGRPTVDRRGVRLQPAATEGGRPTVDRRGVRLQPDRRRGGSP